MRDAAMQTRVMAGIERLVDGDALLISGRALAMFCDDHEFSHREHDG